MTQGRNAPQETFSPLHPTSGRAEGSSQRRHDMLEGRPKDEAAVRGASDGFDEMFDRIAAGLYSLASMLIGEGEESIKLVESAVETTEVSSCESAAEARKNSRRALCAAGIRILERRSPGCLVAPEGLEHAHTCIEEDDLESAGVAGEELSRMLGGPDRDRVRSWLGSLSTEKRVLFVMRAVAGFTSHETASVLADNGGPGAAGWTAEAVREIFRQALCSLASQLIHDTATR
jgi:hypothetical protein